MKLVSFFVLALGLISNVAHAIPIAKFTSDKSIYSVGEKAILRVHLQTEPDNKNLEFHVVVHDDVNNVVVLDLIAPREFLGFTPALAVAGTYTYHAETFIQDRRVAAALNAAITAYTAEIARIDALLAGATDPQVIADLQFEREGNVNKRAAAQSELAHHRVKVDGTKSVQFQVQ